MNVILKNIIFYSLQALIAIVAVISVDRLLLYFEPGLSLAAVMFPPQSKLEVNTPEFSYVASINSMGFRDHEVIDSNTNFRILVLGDSFTYGWGVPLDKTWIKQLEEKLNQQGFDVEVVNLGKPGAGPVEFAQIAEIAIPLLQPDMVMIALQQTDDLQQSLPNSIYDGFLRGAADLGFGARVGYKLRSLFPNISLKISGFSIFDMKWDTTVKTILSLATREEHERFDRLDSEVKKRFLAGELNPGLLVLTLKTPRYYTETGKINSSKTKEKIEAMSSHLRRIDGFSKKVGATVYGVSVPNRIYVSNRYVKSVENLGFEVDLSAINSGWPDGNTLNALAAADIPALSPKVGFAEQCTLVACYFEFDDHLNAYGHQSFANSLIDSLASALADLKKK